MINLEDIPASLPTGDLWLLPGTSAEWPGQGEVSSHTCFEREKLTPKNLSITVLDSSFNPPHRAHLFLATLGQDLQPDQPTANLLLFSLTNVEKVPSPSDPSLAQRLHLMTLLLSHLPPNTAFGLINDPTFAGKSKTIHKYLSTRCPGRPKPELRFVIGADTLTRFFAERYYTNTPGGMDAAMRTFFEDEGCTLISARRGGEDDRKMNEELMKIERVKDLVDRGKVIMAGTGTEDRIGISSTKVRKAVMDNNWDRVDALVVPEIAAYIRDSSLYTS